MNRFFRLSSAALLTFVIAFDVLASPPPTINYQGYLTNAGNVAVNSGASMTFRLYTAASGGTALWTETQPSVAVSNGNFNAVLGVTTPIPLPFDAPGQLTTSVNVGIGVASPTVALHIGGSVIVAGKTMQTADSVTNTVLGIGAAAATTSGADNTAIGTQALTSNTSGSSNTAFGRAALFSTTTGSFNTATGRSALLSNNTGKGNTASGSSALVSNTTGNDNTASGLNVLFSNTVGSFNVAAGGSALTANTTGNSNTAIGNAALESNSTGNVNIAIGAGAGSNLTVGNTNIMIGNPGVAGESGIIRIGSAQTKAFMAGIRGNTTGATDAITVVIDSNGELGTVSSSRSAKDDIADMNDASAKLSQLRPVTFRYNAHGSGRSVDARPLQYGLIAEEVNEVAPELVARNAQGEIETVFYQHLTPMLLNEFQIQQARINALERELANIRALLIANLAKSSTGAAPAINGLQGPPTLVFGRAHTTLDNGDTLTVRQFYIIL